MWRSITAASATLSRQAVHNLCGPQCPYQISYETLSTVVDGSFSSAWILISRYSLSQKPRFLSQFSANPIDSEPQVSEPSDYGLNSQEAELSSAISDDAMLNDIVIENESSNAQVEGFSSEHGIDKMYGQSAVGINESSHTQMEEYASGYGEEVKEREVREVDVEELERVLSLLQSSNDGSLESSLDVMGLNLHEEFVVRVLETPLVAGENLIRFFKWAKVKSEFEVTSRVMSALVGAINGIPKKTDAYSFWDLVKEIGEEQTAVLNVEILNELIALFSKLGEGKAAFVVFNQFDDFGCTPNEDTYYFTIEALCRKSIFDWASSVCKKMLNAECLPDGEKVGKIISWICKGRMAKDAHLIYTFAKKKSKHLPCSSINFLISSLCREVDTVRLAREMLDDFSAETRKYAIKPFSVVIRGLCRIQEVCEAKELLLKMTTEGPPPGNAVFNSVINGYSKAGDMEEAMELMQVMESRGLRPDVYTYTVIISGYTKGGQMEEACKILSKAKENHSKLSPVTYHSLIRGFCKLEEFDKALGLLGEMKEFGVQPNVDEYNKLIQSLCLKALDSETAEKLLDGMKGSNLHLNGITRALIQAVKELKVDEVETAQITS